MRRLARAILALVAPRASASKPVLCGPAPPDSLADDTRALPHTARRTRWRMHLTARVGLALLVAVGAAACGSSPSSAAHRAPAAKSPAASPPSHPTQATGPSPRLAGHWAAQSAPIATAVSCTSATFCMTIGPTQWSVWNGQTWTPQASLSFGDGAAVSCTGPRFCLATSVYGAVYAWNGSQWTAEAQLGLHSALRGISCPTPGFCEAIGQTGDAWQYNGASWTGGTVVDAVPNPANGPTTISCADPGFCVVGDGMSQATELVGTQWTSPRLIDPTGEGVLSVSCPTRAFYLAVTQTGQAVAWNGVRWSTPVTLTGQALVSASCPEAGFCIAVGNGASVAQLDHQWVLRPLPAKTEWGGLDAVSCASADFCLAVSGGPRDFVYTSAVHSSG